MWLLCLSHQLCNVHSCLWPSANALNCICARLISSTHLHVFVSYSYSRPISTPLWGNFCIVLWLPGYHISIFAIGFLHNSQTCVSVCICLLYLYICIWTRVFFVSVLELCCMGAVGALVPHWPLCNCLWRLLQCPWRWHTMMRCEAVTCFERAHLDLHFL